MLIRISFCDQNFVIEFLSTDVKGLFYNSRADYLKVFLLSAGYCEK